MNKNLIAPCGMNCGICSGYLREKNKCSGCNAGPTLPSCQRCRLKLCDQRKGDFCDCQKLPCQRLKQLDKRYRDKYGMSMLENLEFIRKNGIDKFLKHEEKRWVSKKGVFCVHNKKYY
jgi:hypothetical protein